MLCYKYCQTVTLANLRTISQSSQSPDLPCKYWSERCCLDSNQTPAVIFNRQYLARRILGEAECTANMYVDVWCTIRRLVDNGHCVVTRAMWHCNMMCPVWQHNSKHSVLCSVRLFNPSDRETLRPPEEWIFVARSRRAGLPYCPASPAAVLSRQPL